MENMKKIITCEKIVTNKFCCVVCNKEYIKKSSLDKHKILCDFRLKTNRERQIDVEELADIPNHHELVKIVQELTLKMTKMEEKMTQMQQYITRKKRKIDVVLWLNANINSTIGFIEWVYTALIVKPEHFESLMENTIFDSIQMIFENNLSKRDDFIYPIYCFSQKAGIFYVSDKKEDGGSEWRQLVLNDMILMLKTIQKGIINQLTKWKEKNQHQFDDNDRIAILFNKAVIKSMSISFKEDNNLSRIKNGLYHYLKSEINIIEQQLDFTPLKT